MQYLEGESLRERIGGRPLPVAECVALAIQIADGLAAAHERGIVHRDVKSANIIVTPSGQAKVLDFGIATRVDTAAAAEERAGILGTPAFMAPEQARGEPTDHRSDLFSLGVVMYQMATGRPSVASAF